MSPPIDLSLPSAVDEPNALPAGTRFGELEILCTLGVGGFGIVYLARDHSLEREVAIKEYMPSQYAQRDGRSHVSVRAASMRETFELGLRSFVNEARLLARFNHPSLLKVYRFWEDNGTAYMAMPYLQGQSLAEAATAQPTPPPEAWLRRVLSSVLDGLEVLHAQGVVHRDVAPDNIFLPADGAPPILLDFGAARQAISGRTQAFTAILKPSFAPIEQYAEAQGLRQGPWSDFYALAAVMHGLLTGRPPSPAPARAMGDDYQPLDIPGYPRALLAAIDWALRMPVHQRPQTAAAMREVLEGRMAVPEATALPPPPPPPAPPPPPPPDPMELAFADTVQAPIEVDPAVQQALEARIQQAQAQARPPKPPRRASRKERPPNGQGSSRKEVAAPRPDRLGRGLVVAAAGLALILLGLFVSQLKRPSAPALPAAASAPAPVVAAASEPASTPPQPAAMAAASAPAIEYFEMPKPKPAAESPRPARRAAPASRPEPSDGLPVPEARPRSVPAAEPAPLPASEPTPVEPKGPASPADACSDRVFLSRLWCIDRQCETARFKDHPECVRLREQREQRRRQNQP